MDCYRCLIQWGYYVESQNPTDYRYWSIPFTSHYITMATKTYYEPKEEAVPWLVGIDMQKFICGYGANFIGSSYVSCVGIGCQPQWGKMIAEYTTVNFPIPFNTVFGIFGERVYAGDNTADISVEKFNATSFTCNMNAYGTWFWSALGF